MNPEWADKYEAAVRLLRYIQFDYSSVRKELQDMSTNITQRETTVNKQLHEAIDTLEKIVPLPRLEPPQPSPRLEICCLGKFQVSLGWKRIEHWRSSKAKLLLKYLTSQQRHRISKDVLMENLWPGCEPCLANNNLKATVHALRQTLSLDNCTNGGYALILFRDGYYILNSENNVWVDAEEFDYHWNVGKRLEGEGKLDEAMREFKAAEELYRGDYLEDDLYEEWTFLQREALKDRYLFVLSKLSIDSLHREDYEGCVAYCEKILSKDSCREDTYRRLICCHSRLGQRNRAMSWYNICEKTIKSELNMSPEQRTTDLYQKMLQGEHI